MIWSAVMGAAGVGMAAWAVWAANQHGAATQLLERLAVASIGATGVLTSLTAFLRVVWHA